VKKITFLYFNCGGTLKMPINADQIRNPDFYQKIGNQITNQLQTAL